jgi:hypothetical protein
VITGIAPLPVTAFSAATGTVRVKSEYHISIVGDSPANLATSAISAEAKGPPGVVTPKRNNLFPVPAPSAVDAPSPANAMITTNEAVSAHNFAQPESHMR